MSLLVAAIAGSAIVSGLLIIGAVVAGERYHRYLLAIALAQTGSLAGFATMTLSIAVLLGAVR